MIEFSLAVKLPLIKKEKTPATCFSDFLNVKDAKVTSKHG